MAYHINGDNQTMVRRFNHMPQVSSVSFNAGRQAALELLRRVADKEQATGLLLRPTLARRYAEAISSGTSSEDLMNLMVELIGAYLA
jgi:hypothetical protein